MKVAPGNATFRTVPSGAITSIGRKKPEFGGNGCRQKHFTAVNVDALVTDSEQLIEPRTCGADSEKSAITRSPRISSLRRMGIGSGSIPSSST